VLVGVIVGSSVDVGVEVLVGVKLGNGKQSSHLLNKE
jgi:hypothetical protein